MDIYVDANGREISADKFKSQYGDDWEAQAKRLGFTLKKADSVATEDVAVALVDPVTSENMELDSVGTASVGDTQLDRLAKARAKKNAVVKIELPKNRDYGTIFNIPEFKSQSNKDIASAYSQMYGGVNGGFEFDYDKNNISITALNGNTIKVRTTELSPSDMITAASGLDFTGSLNNQVDDSQKLINNFLKDNFDEKLNIENEKNIDDFEGSIAINLKQLSYDFANEEDIAYDPTMMITSLMDKDGFRDYMRKNLIENYAANRSVSGSGFFWRYKSRRCRFNRFSTRCYSR